MRYVSHDSYSWQILIDCSSNSPILVCTIDNLAPPLVAAPIWISGFEALYSHFCGDYPKPTVGTKIEPGHKYTFAICQTLGQPPIPSGYITFSAIAGGGAPIAKIVWKFTGTEIPNTLKAENVISPWHVNVPEVAPHGNMGDVTITIRKGAE